MSKRALASLGAAAVVAAGAAAIPAGAFQGAREASTHTVVLKDHLFHPATSNIRRGDKVKWVWEDSTEHNVTFRGFHSRTQETGTYTVRFTKAGTYRYHCTIHFEQGMRGKIIVQ